MNIQRVTYHCNATDKHTMLIKHTWMRKCYWSDRR